MTQCWQVWLPLCSTFLGGSNSGQIYVYDTSEFQLKVSLGVRKHGIRCVKFSPFRESTVCAACDDGAIQLWDLRTQNMLSLHEKDGHEDACSAIAFSTVNKLLLCSVGIDRSIKFYDINEKKNIKAIKTESPLTALAFYSDGHTIAVGSLYGEVLLYDLRSTNQAKLTMSGHTGAVHNMEFTKDIKKKKEESKRTSGGQEQKSGVQSKFKSYQDIQAEAKKKIEEDRKKREIELKTKAAAKAASVSETKPTVFDKKEKGAVDRSSTSSKKESQGETKSAARLLSYPQKATPPGNSSGSINQGKSQVSGVGGGSKYVDYLQQRTIKEEASEDNYDERGRSAKKLSQDRLRGSLQESRDELRVSEFRNEDFTEQQKKYFVNAVEKRVRELDRQMAEMASSFQVEMIRQFQIQQNELFGFINDELDINTDAIQKYLISDDEY